MQKVTFSESVFSFLEEHVDLNVLFIEKNIEEYITQKDQFSLEDEFIEKLLNSSIEDTYKLQILAGMDLAAISNSPDRASVVGRLLYRTDGDEYKKNKRYLLPLGYNWLLD